MDVFNGFVINSEEIYTPKYNIGPFDNEHIVPLSGNTEGIKPSLFEYLFPEREISLAESGRQAIAVTLECLKLKKNDCITILTSTGNSYISSCVTNEIEKFCGWSRSIEPNTKALFVNHEFGFPYEELYKLKEEHELPIIEDVAHGLFSQNKEKSVGTIGDFIICSLPKIFPVQFGGVLISKIGFKVKTRLSNQKRNYLLKLQNCTIKELKLIREKRQSNYKYLTDAFRLLGLKPYFELTEDINPGVYMINFEGFKKLNELKIFMQNNGVESSVFYGAEAFFIPVHQNLKRSDLDYFVSLIEYFIKENKE